MVCIDDWSPCPASPSALERSSMLFQIRCSCGHEGFTTSLPRLLRCSARDAVRLFKASQGQSITAPAPKWTDADDEEASKSVVLASHLAEAQPAAPPLVGGQ
jgi:hypothetical protein